jgi:hypothetical protein
MPNPTPHVAAPREAANHYIQFSRGECIMAKKNKGDDEFRPTGTIAILAIFVITLIAIWTTIYMILVGRGGTL